VPEHAESWDAGFAWTRDWSGASFALEWAHHESDARDLILYERSSPRGARPVNVGAAWIEGEETALRMAWNHAELRASTSWLSATDRSGLPAYQGKRLPQRAERQSYARLTWQRAGWLVSGDVEYLGDMFLDRANTKHEPERTLTGASLGRRIGRATLLAEGRNLGDVLAEDVAGFPLAGPHVLPLAHPRSRGGRPPALNRTSLLPARRPSGPILILLAHDFSYPHRTRTPRLPCDSLPAPPSRWRLSCSRFSPHPEFTPRASTSWSPTSRAEASVQGVPVHI
jgi:hypothetical protein